MDPLKISQESVEKDLALVEEIDLSKRYKILGIQKQGDLYTFDFFNRQIVFMENDFKDLDGKIVTLALKTVLLKYMVMCPDKLVKSDNRLVTFRELSNGSPLFSSFTANTAKTIENTFSNQIDLLKLQCQKLGVDPIASNGFDLSVRFRALPRVPIILNFNDQDDGMPAQASFLYHGNANTFLDLTALGIICTYLTGLLIQN
ncbi:MAG: DUF3786 domain-containing protein [Pseudomonadota bacterium]